VKHWIFFVAWLAGASAMFGAKPERIAVDGREREYLLHTPAGLSDAPVPVVFVFHGGGGKSAGVAKLTKFSELADREKFLVVYPQGIDGGFNDGRVTKVLRAHREQVDDLAFFDALLAEIARRHRVDPKRVFATGISNGGMFSHYLAANRSEKIAAIAPVVGGIAVPFDAKFNPARPVSVLIIQGTEDPLVPYDGGPIGARARQDRGSVVATAAAIELWRAANGCAAEPEISALPDLDQSDGCRTEVSVWSGGREGSEVWLYRVVGGGHTWPGGAAYATRRAIGRVTHDFGSEAIWEFFKTHPKP
jgi:polyhydroxybutyrate depolymerase